MRPTVLPGRAFLVSATLMMSIAATTPVAVGADGVVAGALRVERAWTRATAAGAPTAGAYFSITNTGADNDRLLSVTSPRAERAEIHEMAVRDEVMTMRPLADGLSIPAGATVVLAPGGRHVMLMGLDGAIAEGDLVELTVTFERAGDITVSMPAAAIGAREPPAAPPGHE